MSSEEKPDAKVHWDRRRFLIGGGYQKCSGEPDLSGLLL
jgi:hypothetical protein